MQHPGQSNGEGQTPNIIKAPLLQDDNQPKPNDGAGNPTADGNLNQIQPPRNEVDVDVNRQDTDTSDQ